MKDPFEEVEVELRKRTIDNVMKVFDFEVITDVTKQRFFYFKRIGDVALSISLIGDKGKLPESWDDQVGLSFLEYWTDSNKPTFIHADGDQHHRALLAKASHAVTLAASFETESEVLNFLDTHHPPAEFEVC